MAHQKHRLARELRKFCNNNEFNCSIDPDQLAANVEFEHNGKRRELSYAFSRDDNHYDAGSKIGKVETGQLGRLAKRIFSSEPTRGVTERLTRRGDLYVMTSRDGLRDSSDATLHSFYLDDISRTAEADDKLSKMMPPTRNKSGWKK